MEKEIEFLKFVIENLVEKKESIVIDKKEDELGILLTLKIDKSDMGVVIGKNGNIITAIRSLLKIIGIKIGKRVNLKVLD